MKKTSIRDMYLIEMINYTLSFIIVMACGIHIPIIFFEKISNYSKALGIIFVLGLTILCLLLVIFSLKKIIALLKDFKALKSNDYISITGKVIKFKKNRDSETGVQINNTPVIINVETNEEIVLRINDSIIVGEIYKFNYLKNSKIAEVVEKNQIINEFLK